MLGDVGGQRGSEGAPTMPAGRHYAITTGVSTTYGGMTTAMLHRSRCFVEQTGTPVTVLTYDDHRDYDEVRRTLTETGRLADGVDILNLFEDVSTWDAEQLQRAVPTLDAALTERFREPADIPPGRHPGFRVERAPDTTITKVNRYRADGSLVISSRRDVDGHDRIYTLFDHDERAIGTWASESELLHFWLDTVPRDPVAWFIVDSKTSAKSLVHYQRDDVVTMHLVHSTHLQFRTDGQELLNFREYVLRRMDGFDAMVFLTSRQLADVTRLLGEGTRPRFAIGNACIVPDHMPRGRRPMWRGVMVGRLDSGKQVDHAIRAVLANQDVVNPWHRPRLDVYGDGDRRDRLEEQIAKGPRGKRVAFTRLLSRLFGRRLGGALGRRLDRRPLKPAVALHGYRTDARSEFARAGFAMVTSRSEGFAMTVVEAMGNGCIPICYDLPYGPGEIVTDGVDGLLVPHNDRKALEQAVRRLMTMSRGERRAMRQAAFRRAHDYDGVHVTRQWITAMHETLRVKTGSATPARPASPSTTSP